MIRHKIYALATRVRGKFLMLVHGKHFCGRGALIADRNTHLILDEGSKIEINGTLRLNDKSIVPNGRSTIVRIDKGGSFIVNGDASIFYGSDIIVFPGGKLCIGNSFINSDSKIRCHGAITIGDDCAVSHNLTVMDSDAHYLNGDNHKKEVHIGNHVWIGTHVTILSGVTVGDGAVIAAGSLVKDSVSPKSLVAGVPAREIKSDVEWSE